MGLARPRGTDPGYRTSDRLDCGRPIAASFILGGQTTRARAPGGRAGFVSGGLDVNSGEWTGQQLRERLRRLMVRFKSRLTQEDFDTFEEAGRRAEQLDRLREYRMPVLQRAAAEMTRDHTECQERLPS